MVGSISPVASSLIQLGGATITLSPQDPWASLPVTILGVFIGGLITLIVSYVLQNRLFNEQRKAGEMDRRLGAYKDLLHEIWEYEGPRRIGQDLKFSMAQVIHYGSDEVKNIIEPSYDKLVGSSSDGLDEALKKAKETMNNEIADRPRYNRPRWQFW